MSLESPAKDNIENDEVGENSTEDVPSPLIYGRKTKGCSISALSLSFEWAICEYKLGTVVPLANVGMQLPWVTFPNYML